MRFTVKGSETSFLLPMKSSASMESLVLMMREAAKATVHEKDDTEMVETLGSTGQSWSLSDQKMPSGQPLTSNKW